MALFNESKIKFYLEKIDKDFCLDFKNQLEKFTSIDNAYGAATKLNRDHNPEYKSNKSTSLELKIRKRTPVILIMQIFKDKNK